MNKAITIELQFFLISVLWGVILLFAYDLLRIIRRVLKHNSFFLAIEDLIFWVVSSVFIFAMMYRENNGIIRGFSIMGMMIGMVLYHYGISEWFVTSVTKLIYILMRPFAIIINRIKKVILFVLKKFEKLVKLISVRLKKLHKSSKIVINKRKQKAMAKRTAEKEKKAYRKKLHLEQKLAKKEEKQNKKHPKKLNEKQVKKLAKKQAGKNSFNNPSGLKEFKSINGSKPGSQFERISQIDNYIKKS